MPAPSLDEWIALIRRFVDGSIAADEFGASYFSLEERAFEASEEGQPWVQPDSTAWILHDFFIEVDRLSDDPKSRDDSLTTDELRRSARRVVLELEQIAAGSPSRPGALQSVLGLAFFSVFLVGQAVAFAGYALWRTARWLAVQIVRPLRRG